MKNWKTTLFGVIAAAAAGVSAAYNGTAIGQIAAIVSSISTSIGLMYAKDSNVTGVGPDAVSK